MVMVVVVRVVRMYLVSSVQTCSVDARHFGVLPADATGGCLQVAVLRELCTEELASRRKLESNATMYVLPRSTI